MDDLNRPNRAGVTATNSFATFWPPATNPQASGNITTNISRDDSRLLAWPYIYGKGSPQQQVVDEALRRIASGEVRPPSPLPCDIAYDETFEFLMEKFADAVDDGRNPYQSGVPKVIETLHVVRLLDQTQPNVGEDVRFLRGVGFAFVFHSRSKRLIRVEPGLVEARNWDGEFFLSNPQWTFTLSGRDLLDSGRTLASSLGRHGIDCDEAELDAWLRSGLRARLQSQAYPDPIDPDDCKGGVR